MPVKQAVDSLGNPLVPGAAHLVAGNKALLLGKIGEVRETTATFVASNGQPYEEPHDSFRMLKGKKS